MCAHKIFNTLRSFAIIRRKEGKQISESGVLETIRCLDTAEFCINEEALQLVLRFRNEWLEGNLSLDDPFPIGFRNALNRCTRHDAKIEFKFESRVLINLTAEDFDLYPDMINSYFSMMNVAANKFSIRKDEGKRDVFFGLESMPIEFTKGEGPRMIGNVDIIKTQARLYFPLQRSVDYSSEITTFFTRMRHGYQSEWEATWKAIHEKEKRKVDYFEQYVLVVVDIKWHSIAVFGAERPEGVFLMERATDWTQRLMESNKASFEDMVNIRV